MSIIFYWNSVVTIHFKASQLFIPQHPFTSHITISEHKEEGNENWNELVHGEAPTATSISFYFIRVLAF
jgi:hypothetical protein